MKQKFNIGDEVWHPKLASKEKRIVCGDCQGKGYLTVILGDDSRVMIDCEGCNRGYEGPCGYNVIYTNEPCASFATITRIESNGGVVEYGSADSFNIKECDLYESREDAKKKAIEIGRKLEDEQIARLYRKENDHRSWAWHVSYYRKLIRRAKKEIERCEQKLRVALEKNK